MNIKTEMVTPEIAKAYLERNTENYRQLDEHRVSAYATDMETGRWELNGEAIKFKSDGTLADGQHRLSAIVKSGIPQFMIIITDIDNNVSVYDVGKNRTLLQIARSDGYFLNGTAISAANWFINYKLPGERVSSKGVVLAHLKEHENDWNKSIHITKKGAKNSIASNAATCLAVYCLLRTGWSESCLSDFFDVVNSGFPNPSYDSSAAIVFRNSLLNRSFAKLNSKERKKMMFSVTVSAFNDFVSSRHRERAYAFNQSNLKLIETVRVMDLVNNASN